MVLPQASPSRRGGGDALFAMTAVSSAIRQRAQVRRSYPIDFIPNADPRGLAPHPGNIVMLTCDAFGVMPPIAKLTPEQAMYHFLSGYTARVAGTEKGLGNAPEATFSTCFGAPFIEQADLRVRRYRRKNAAE
jgi:ATP-dependent phosphoenolpyruvate carboxykinase